MESQLINQQINLKLQKRIKDIKGFYTHSIASFLIIPFIIFINLKTAPQIQWFWYAIIAWCVGLFIHWLNVFRVSKNNFKKNWEQRKMKEFMGDDSENLEKKEDLNQIDAQIFINAKNGTKEIKGFYIHLLVEIFSFVIIVIINLMFVPDFHFFWFALIGMSIAVFFHWLGVFGFEYLGLGKKWEARKMKELLNKQQ